MKKTWSKKSRDTVPLNTVWLENMHWLWKIIPHNIILMKNPFFAHLPNVLTWIQENSSQVCKFFKYQVYLYHIHILKPMLWMATKPALCKMLPYLKVWKSANKRHKNSFAKLQPTYNFTLISKQLKILQKTLSTKKWKKCAVFPFLLILHKIRWAI